MLTKQGLRLAIDIGGTFTDTVLIDAQDAILATAKTPTTPANPTLGAHNHIPGAIFAAIRPLCHARAWADRPR